MAENSYESKRIDSVEANQARMDRHIGGIEVEVGVIGKAVSGLEATLVDYGGMLRQIAEKQNTPAEKPNWYGLIGAIAVLLALLAGYVTLSLQPGNREDFRHTSRLSEISTLISIHDQKREVAAATLSSLTTEQAQTVKLRDQKLILDNITIGRITALEIGLAKQKSFTQVRLDALEDYTKYVNEKGSRKYLQETYVH